MRIEPQTLICHLKNNAHDRITTLQSYADYVFFHLQQQLPKKSKSQITVSILVPEILEANSEYYKLSPSTRLGYNYFSHIR